MAALPVEGSSLMLHAPAPVGPTLKRQEPFPSEFASVGEGGRAPVHDVATRIDLGVTEQGVHLVQIRFREQI